MPPPILILSRSEAAMLLRGPRGAAEIAAALVIRGRHDPELDLPPGLPHLVLRFDDLAPVDLSDPLQTLDSLNRQRWARETGRTLVPPSEADARHIIDFARRHAGATGAVLFVCQGGISRSSAAALIALATWLGPGREADCARQVAAIRQGARPLAGLVAFADALLDRNGALREAIRTIG